ncbi:MAG TPA: 3-phosphoshikimate 1-carboxyvinyltransferase [Conexibacter sp.]|nr:3-phosphoshikimate 1-carboxyvinyltransferase [Conexibacter sp.]
MTAPAASQTARFEAASGGLRGSLRVPADKSISHRAALFGAMSSGPVRVTNYLDAADTNSTLAAVQALGARVDSDPARPGELTIHGVGLRGAREAAGAVDVGNAGTLMRLIAGWLAAQPGGSWTLDGDDSIRSRPMGRVVEPLRLMGARIDAREDRFAPLTIRGGQLHGIEYASPVASAQVKSCVLIAGMATADGASVIEPHPSRDHTERMLARAGAPISRDGLRVTVGPVDALELGRVDVPGDLSSAAFFVAAALLVPGSRIVLQDVNVNWTRIGFLRIAERMGARIGGELEPAGAFAAVEPVSALEVEHGPLRGTTVEAEEVPLAIDELPLVALLGCFAEGETVVRGAGELRVKESDRIATVVDGLRALGGEIEATADGFVVQGRGPGSLRGGRIASHGDHRLAMLGAIAGLASREGVEVAGMDAAAVSYPGFAADLSSLLAG